MLNRIEAMLLFVRDLDKCRAFYQDILGLKVQDSEPDAVGFALGDRYFALFTGTAAARLIGSEAKELKIEGGPRGLLAASVENVDAMYEMLSGKGVTLLGPPADQPWGLRTAYFADPEGNLWEINQPVSSKSEG